MAHIDIHLFENGDETQIKIDDVLVAAEECVISARAGAHTVLYVQQFKKGEDGQYIYLFSESGMILEREIVEYDFTEHQVHVYSHL